MKLPKGVEQAEVNRIYTQENDCLQTSDLWQTLTITTFLDEKDNIETFVRITTGPEGWAIDWDEIDAFTEMLRRDKTGE